MTVNLHLEEVPFAILELVKARILANRRRLAAANSRPRPSLRPRAQFRKHGADSRTWRKPQYSTAIHSDYVLAHTVIDYTLDQDVEESVFLASYGINNQGVYRGGGTRYTTFGKVNSVTASIRSQDGSSSQSFKVNSGMAGRLSVEREGWNVQAVSSIYHRYSRPATPICSSSYLVQPIVLPIEAESCIVIVNLEVFSYSLNCLAITDMNFVGWGDNGEPPLNWSPDEPPFIEPDYLANQVSGFEAKYDAQQAIKAFFCNKTTVREVTIPSDLRSVLNEIAAGRTASSRSFTFYGSDPSSIPSVPIVFTGNYSIPVFAGTALDAAACSDGLLTYGTGSVLVQSGSPSVFQAMNELVPFTLDETHSFGDSQWLLADPREEGAFSPSSPGDPAGIPFYYAEWPNPGEQPNFSFFDDPQLPGAVVPDALNDASATIASNTIGNGYVLAVWDWDDPDYCQAMCRALGFTEDDLKP